jgi:hypothetical protein
MKQITTHRRDNKLTKNGEDIPSTKNNFPQKFVFEDSIVLGLGAFFNA